MGQPRALPLQSFHVHQPKDLATGRTTDCVNTLLQIGFYASAPLTAPLCHISYTAQRGAYLIKGCEETQNCVNIDAQNDWPSLTHRYVARLADVPIAAAESTSQGFVVATSQLGTRIAIAAWDDVFLYAIEPYAFLDSNKGSGARTKKGLKGSLDDLIKSGRIRLKRPGEEDHAYMRKCGQPYYQEVDGCTGLPVIKPTKLPSAGVVYAMEFVGEHHLWAWTDKGLVKWYWGPGRQGAREEYALGTFVL